MVLWPLALALGGLSTCSQQVGNFPWVVCVIRILLLLNKYHFREPPTMSQTESKRNCFPFITSYATEIPLVSGVGISKCDGLRRHVLQPVKLYCCRWPMLLTPYHLQLIHRSRRRDPQIRFHPPQQINNHLSRLSCLQALTHRKQQRNHMNPYLAPRPTQRGPADLPTPVVDLLGHLSKRGKTVKGGAGCAHGIWRSIEEEAQTAEMVVLHCCGAGW